MQIVADLVADGFLGREFKSSYQRIHFLDGSEELVEL